MVNFDVKENGVGVRHSKEELAEMQSLPLDLKIRLTENRIRGWYNEYYGDVYCSRSGGKDSDVLGDIVRKMYPNVPHIYISTGLEWKSVQNHGVEVADEILYPEMNFVEVIKKYGYPVISKEVSQKVEEARRKPDGECAKRFTDCEHNRKYPQYSLERYAYLLDAPFKISHKCCDISKKNPAKAYEKRTGRKAIVATMASESLLRKTRWLRTGCNAFESKRPVSAPLSFWTENDILQYIAKNDIPIASIYGNIVAESDGFQYFIFDDNEKLTTTGAKRTGCIWCLFGITQDPERLVRLKKYEPRRYEYVMNGGEFVDGMWMPNKNGLGYRFVVDWLNQHRSRKIRY